MAVYLTPDGLNSTVGGEMPNYPLTFSRVGGTASYLTSGGSTSYLSPAVRICRLGGSTESYVKGRYLKTGDLNYSNQHTDVMFEAHIWSVTNNLYGLRARAGSFSERSAYMWVDANKDLWIWQNDLWTTYGTLFIYDSRGADFTSASNSNMAPSGSQTKAWTGQTRHLVNATTTINLENTFGNPA